VLAPGLRAYRQRNQLVARAEGLDDARAGLVPAFSRAPAEPGASCPAARVIAPDCVRRLTPPGRARYRARLRPAANAAGPRVMKSRPLSRMCRNHANPSNPASNTRQVGTAQGPGVPAMSAASGRRESIRRTIVFSPLVSLLHATPGILSGGAWRYAAIAI